MVFRIAAIPMTLSDLASRSFVATVIVFKCDFFIQLSLVSCVTVDKISTEIVYRAASLR